MMTSAEQREMFQNAAVDAGFMLVSKRGLVVWSNETGATIRPVYKPNAVMATVLDSCGMPERTVYLADLVDL